MAQAGPPACRFQPARATRAHLLKRLWVEEAVPAYDAAIDLTHDPAERAYLRQRRARVAGRAAGRHAEQAVEPPADRAAEPGERISRRPRG